MSILEHYTAAEKTQQKPYAKHCVS